jgi:hypothetical protein
MPLLADSQTELKNLANTNGDTGKIVDGGQGTGAPGTGPVVPGGPGTGTTVPTTQPAKPANPDPPIPASHTISPTGKDDPIVHFLQKKSTIMLGSAFLGGIVGALALGGPAGLLMGAVLGLMAGYVATNYFGAGKGKT